MVALAPVYHWAPEDDFLLKNAVEAGASLESLSKGAVLFSRRFTVQELQDRWHSLLYDPVISVEASSHMIEFELSSSTVPSKSCRSQNTKENICVSGKRKAESICKCYHALRKRICNEPFGSMDVAFLFVPDNKDDVGNECEPPSADVVFEGSISNPFGLQDSNLDTTHHTFPEFGASGVTAELFCTGSQHQVAKNLIFGQNNMPEKVPRTFEENLPHTGNCSSVQELGQPKEMSLCNLFETDNKEAKPSMMFDQVRVTEENVCPGFGGDHVLNSPISDCCISFQNFQYSSSVPHVQSWSTIENISPPTLPDVHIGKEMCYTGNIFELHEDGDANDAHTLGCDVVNSDTRLKCQMSRDHMKNYAPNPDEYLTELSNTLFDFTDEEDFPIDKSYIDGLSSLLLDAPNDGNRHKITSSEASVAPEEFLNIPGIACSGELGGKEQYNCGDVHMVSCSEAQMTPSASAVLCHGVSCCTLNTEDPEIPCNDDVYVPNQMPSSPLSSVMQGNFHEACYRSSSSVKDFSCNQRTNSEGLNLMKRDQNNYEQSHLSSQMLGSLMLSEMGLDLPIGDCWVKVDLPNTDTQLGFRYASTSSGGLSQISLVNECTLSLFPLALKEEITNTEQAKHLSYHSADSCLERQVNGFNKLPGCPQKNDCRTNPEVDVPAMSQRHELSHAELGSMKMTVPEVSVDASPSGHEEFPSESDYVPCFSDVEAMILDMDLSPDDKGLYFSREVSRFQHEDTNRAIIRLEQAADACMQRVISSQEAFAVLYGRYSRHYIKKSEVLVGRATEDVNVDIDLGREWRGNKISRRQAIIMIDEGGSFHLKNLGRFSIFVNGKEVAPKQSLNLTSNCLIEIRGMALIFETNRALVKQCMDTITRRSQSQEHKV